MHSSTKKAAEPKRLTKNGKVYGDLLSAEEKKKLVLQKKKDKKAKKVRKSAQQTIPYVEMCRDGICKVNSRLYTRTIRFNDINYQLAQNEDKTAIFENWCDFLNYFDSSIFVQFSFINQRTSISEFKKQINIPEQDDEFNDIRSEYSEMLQNQLTKGNNGLIKRKYITFGIEADSLRMAKAKLDRIETDILNNFKTLGVKTEPLSGYERLKVLHDVFNMDSNEPFRFSFDMVARTGLSSKDFIAPTSFDFREGKCFKMGKAIGAVSFLQILAPELNDRMLADFLDMDSNITVNLHIRTIDQAKAIKSIKMKITDLDKMKIEEQKKAVRSGYDMEIIPSDLATYGGEAKRLLQDLQTRNERMFLVTILIMNTAASRQKLENAIFQTASIAQKYNCALKRLDFQQEEGLMSSLPIGLNQIEIERGLTTSSTAVFVPFTTQELFQSGEALYYGLNALSNNMIMVDRKQLKNPNGLILGTPGSGKSFSAKREMTNAFLITEDDIIVCDPEAEYYPLVQKLGGQVIRISPVSTDYINPLDINVNYSEEENPLTLKSDFILSMCELIVGGKDGLQPVEKTIIDRSVRKVYQDYRTSMQANMDCKEAIEQTINDYYGNNRLAAESAVKSILEKFSPERVAYVLAQTIQQKDHDGRISPDCKEWAKGMDGSPDHATQLIIDSVNPGLVSLFTEEFVRQTVISRTQEQAPAEQSKPAVPEKAPKEPEQAVPAKHRLTPEEKKIKEAVMDTLKAQIASRNDGMLATYHSSNQSFKVMMEYKVRIEGNTVTRDGEPMFAIHRRHSAKKVQGCYRELTPMLEYIGKEKTQEAAREKPSIREQLRAAAKSQPERKAPVKQKSRDAGLE